VNRENRYSWTYMLRRPYYNDRSVVETTVVVYSGRPASFPLAEQVYAGTAGSPIRFDPTSNVVRVTWDTATGRTKPALRKGSWILDATMVHTNPGGVGGPFRPDPHGFFYRVTGVTDLPAVGTIQGVELELQTNP